MLFKIIFVGGAGLAVTLVINYRSSVEENTRSSILRREQPSTSSASSDEKKIAYIVLL